MCGSRKVLALMGILPALMIAAPAAHASFPGLNGRIAFYSDRDGNYEIYSMNPDGTGQTRLTNDPGEDVAPAWSPDGSRIAFSSAPTGDQEIYLMNADGSGRTQVSNTASFASNPTWSPDGTRIAFSARPTVSGHIQIHVVNADGTGQTMLTNTAAENVDPDWSPDGSRIVFETTRDGNFEIYTMNADGSAQTRLTVNDGLLDVLPVWSPDASRLAFFRCCGAGSGIYTMNANGSAQTNINGSGTEPAWSPDGQKIAFVDSSGLPGAKNDIHAMNFDGTSPAVIAGSAGNDFAPSWQAVPIAPSPGGGGFKNAATFCKAERKRLGEDAFRKRYGTNRNKANALGKCVSSNAGRARS